MYNQQKSCYFCKKNIGEIDYKNGQQLTRYMSGWSRIKPSRITGTCSRHQRLLTQAIKRARFLAVISYVSR